MPAKLLREDADQVVFEVTIPKSRDFLQCEEQIQDALNDAGRLATGKCLEDFDTDGSPIIIGREKHTAKNAKVSKKYESPYGTVAVERYAYQSSQGGEVHIPLEYNARIVAGSTPRFAKIISFDYAQNNSSVVKASLKQTLNREVSRCYIQDISAAVAAHVDDKSRYWDYAKSEPNPQEVASISIGIDGACLLFCEDGYRQAMVGTVAFFDASGERLHTNYIAAAPEHGKWTFLKRMDEEIARVKSVYSDVRYVGVSDGAADFHPWLKTHTTTQILDFWHLTEYIHGAAEAIARKKAEREAWIEVVCHKLKHQHGAAQEILDELKSAQPKKLSKRVREHLDAAISYIENNSSRMNYASYRKSHLPIGSGITEAACKTVVKNRMCGSGMKWTQSGSDSVLSLRALALTTTRWEEFWANVAKFGFTAPASV